MDHWLGYSRKKNNRGIEGILFWKPPGIFNFSYFTPGNSRQNKTPTLEIPQNCVRSLGNFNKAKPPRLLDIPHYLFLVTLVNSFCYFFDTLESSISSTPLPTPFGFLLEQPIWIRPAGYLAACKLRRFQCAWFAPAVRWNFVVVADSVYITENLSWFCLLIFDKNLTDFIPPNLAVEDTVVTEAIDWQWGEDRREGGRERWISRSFQDCGRTQFKQKGTFFLIF